MFVPIQNRIICPLISNKKQNKTKNYSLQNFKFFILCLCGCESWCLIQREKYRFMGFANKVLKTMFLLKREEVAQIEKTA
jgi:hypothetical protein